MNRIYFNYRDHRKIAVIDGQYAYTGGVNIADEYANLIVRFGHWKDTAVRIEGEGVWGFATQFMQMWKMMGGTFHNEDDYYRPRHPVENVKGWCQPFTDGPLNNPDNPVEESMQKALCIAADAGVDVRLFIPGIPDHHKFTYMVAETYWGELLSHGVKIYKYTPGFLHAKSVMVDREVALDATGPSSCTTNVACCCTTCRWWRICWRTWTAFWKRAGPTRWRIGTTAPGSAGCALPCSA